MVVDNKLDKAFGPSGVFAGYILLIVGVVSILSGVGLIVALIGAFTAFTYSGVQINTDKKVYRSYSSLFGALKVGQWKKLSGFTQITVLKSKKKYTTFSRSNRSIETSQIDYRVNLVAPNRNDRVAVKKCSSLDEAYVYAEGLGAQLDIPVVRFN